MILDGSLKLEIAMSSTASTSQPEIHVNYFDWNPANQPTLPSYIRTATNNVTDVTILAAPPTNPRREIQRIQVFNKDTASQIFTVKTDDGSTERILVKRTLTTLQSLCFEKGTGWYILATS